MKSIALSVAALGLVISGFAPPAFAAQTPGVATIKSSGSPTDCLDIVIVAEGYTAAEIPQFAIDAQGTVDYLFGGLEPWTSLGATVNVHRIDAVSAESGADNPPGRPGLNVDTAFGAYFADSPLIGSLQVFIGDAPAVQRAALAAPGSDVIVVLVNVNAGSGTGYPGMAVACAGPGGPITVAHELGHSLAGLADEYGGNPTPYTGPEPSEPNVTTDSNPLTIKWGGLLGLNGTGVFEGGQYHDHGIFRPAQDCMMRNAGRPYCEVCRRVLEGRIRSFATGSGGGPPPSQTYWDGGLVGDGNGKSGVGCTTRTSGTGGRYVVVLLAITAALGRRVAALPAPRSSSASRP